MLSTASGSYNFSASMISYFCYSYYYQSNSFNFYSASNPNLYLQSRCPWGTSTSAYPKWSSSPQACSSRPLVTKSIPSLGENMGNTCASASPISLYSGPRWSEKTSWRGWHLVIDQVRGEAGHSMPGHLQHRTL